MIYINVCLLQWLPHPLLLWSSLWKNFIQLYPPLQAPYQPQVQIRAAWMCNSNWLQAKREPLGTKHPMCLVPSLAASQFGRVKGWCWQSEPGASSQTRSRRRARARLPPEWQHFNIDADQCTLQGKGKTVGNIVSVSWRGVLQNYKCHYFALHLYLTDRNTHTYPDGKLMLHLLLVICKWYHVQQQVVMCIWHAASKHQISMIQLHWEDAPERTGGVGKGNIQLHHNPQHPYPTQGGVWGSPDTPSPVNLHL